MILPRMHMNSSDLSRNYSKKIHYLSYRTILILFHALIFIYVIYLLLLFIHAAWSIVDGGRIIPDAMLCLSNGPN